MFFRIPRELTNPSDKVLNGSEVFSLLADQRIIGIYNSDTLGYVESILQWDKDEFSLKSSSKTY